ncbi:MAG: response regulator [Magnetococcales bacterium]|nr:response regulator [Magnetococcales bacterium]
MSEQMGDSISVVSEHGRARTPILALTAHAMREYQERSLSAGCDGHLSKPIHRNQLIESVQTHLEWQNESTEAA